MFAYLKKLLGRKGRAGAGRITLKKARARSRVSLEALEERQLLTNGIMVHVYHDPMTDLPGRYTLGATATSAADTFRFDAPAPGMVPPGTPTVYFNGLDYTGVDLNLIDHFIFQGFGAGSHATLNVHGAGQPLDPNGYDLRLYGNHGHLQEATYDLTLQKIPTIIANGDAANGWATLYGSKTMVNTFLGTATSSTMFNAGSYDQANGFHTVLGYAGDAYNYAFGTPQDRAILHGSASIQSHFDLIANGTPGISVYAGILFSAIGTVSYADGFHKDYAFAGTKSDIADFRGSNKGIVSTFTSHGVDMNGVTYSTMAANNGAFFFEAFDCRYVGAVAGTKVDVAKLYGSTGVQNTLTVALDGNHRSDIRLTSSMHSDEVVGFKQIDAFSPMLGGKLMVFAGSTSQLPALFPHTHRRVMGQSLGGPSLTFQVDAYDFV
jgi:hypothetical protein